MKEKYITNKIRVQYLFFSFLIAPFLIGLFVFFIPQAHSKWEKEDIVLQKKSPEQQGWAQVNFKEDKESLLSKESPSPNPY